MHLKRLKYRTDTWDKNFRKYIVSLQKKKKVIVCGDLNVAHEEIDLKNPKTNKNAKAKGAPRNGVNPIL